MEFRQIFNELYVVFHENNFKLFAVGGTTRDFLLNKNIDDFDFVTDATPDEMELFLPNCNTVFKRFGVIIYQIRNVKVQITTFRKEQQYEDMRHPKQIFFVKEMKEDYLRRDFTINALYMAIDGKIYDYSSGLKDLNDKVIKTIGNPNKRIKEDPLRIFRALRFQVVLDFELDENLKKAIYDNKHLIINLNKEKIIQELKKVSNKDRYAQLLNLLNKYEINLFNLDIPCDNI